MLKSFNELIWFPSLCKNCTLKLPLQRSAARYTRVLYLAILLSLIPPDFYSFLNFKSPCIGLQSLFGGIL